MKKFSNVWTKLDGEATILLHCPGEQHGFTNDFVAAKMSLST